MGLRKPTRKIEHWEHVFISDDAIYTIRNMSPWDTTLNDEVIHLRSTLLETFEIEDK